MFQERVGRDTMSDPNAAGLPLVIATSDGAYYVIPMAALEQFKATGEQRA